MSKKSKISSAYQTVERQALGEAEDPHFIVLMMFDALLKAMALFSETASSKEESQLEIKSDSFARSLTIIYALQSSLDFEKGGNISENLFQLYEFSRQQMLSDMRKGHADGVHTAIEILTEIRDAWSQIGPQSVASE
jgi:flagellar protein FliS